MLVTDFRGALGSGNVGVDDFDDSEEIRRFLLGGIGVSSFSFSHSARNLMPRTIVNKTGSKIRTLEFFRVCGWWYGTAREQLLAPFLEASFFYFFDRLRSGAWLVNSIVGSRK